MGLLRPASGERFTIDADGPNRWIVEGHRIVQFVEMMDTEMEGAREEVERRLQRWGVLNALRRAGARHGDAVVFGESTITFEDL